jgi:hypothetical protein
LVEDNDEPYWTLAETLSWAVLRRTQIAEGLFRPDSEYETVAVTILLDSLNPKEADGLSETEEAPCLSDGVGGYQRGDVSASRLLVKLMDHARLGDIRVSARPRGRLENKIIPPRLLIGLRIQIAPDALWSPKDMRIVYMHPHFSVAGVMKVWPAPPPPIPAPPPPLDAKTLSPGESDQPLPSLPPVPMPPPCRACD